MSKAQTLHIHIQIAEADRNSSKIYKDLNETESRNMKICKNPAIVFPHNFPHE